MKSGHFIDLAAAAAIGLSALLFSASDGFAGEVTIGNASPKEVGVATQFEVRATCDNSVSCTAYFPKVPPKRFEIQYANCRFDGPYEILDAYLADDTTDPNPATLDLPLSWVHGTNLSRIATFAAPVVFFVQAGHQVAVVVSMIGQGGPSHLRCLISGNMVVLP